VTVELSDYAERFAEHLVLERQDGILQVRLHTRGGPALFSLGLKHALSEVWHWVGTDPDNEVVIVTGTGDAWIGGVDPSRSPP
jgi:enoyl-CoA hydratase/carnithine racemase